MKCTKSIVHNEIYQKQDEKIYLFIFFEKYFIKIYINIYKNMCLFEKWILNIKIIKKYIYNLYIFNNP